MYAVTKIHKRLYVVAVGTGERVYTPPSFVRPPSREPMWELARAFTAARSRDIGAIMAFETTHTKRT
jgi:hypothetical protein